MNRRKLIALLSSVPALGLGAKKANVIVLDGKRQVIHGHDLSVGDIWNGYAIIEAEHNEYPHLDRYVGVQISPQDRPIFMR